MDHLLDPGRELFPRPGDPSDNGSTMRNAFRSTHRKGSFKQQYDEAERRRAAILQRLAGLNEAAHAHPAFRRAVTLVKSDLPQGPPSPSGSPPSGGGVADRRAREPD